MERERELFTTLLVERPSRGRCATCSSPSAPPPRSRTCREDTAARRSTAVGVIGAGTMGGGIAMNFVNAGIPVTDRSR